jgi:hypothetical protein
VSGLFAGDTRFEVGAHVRPRHGFAGGEEFGVARVGQRFEFAAALGGSGFSTMASSMKWCAVVPLRFAASAIRDFKSSFRRSVVVDMAGSGDGMERM